MNEADARRFARDMVELLRSPKELLKSQDGEQNFSIGDVFRIGGMLLGGVNQATREHLLKEKNQMHIGTVLRLVHDPDAMEKYFFDLIMKNGDAAGDIKEAIAQVESLISKPVSKRKLLKQAIAEAMPEGNRGRPTAFDPVAAPTEMIQLSTRLEPVCDRFLRMRRQHSKKTPDEILAFLESEDPEAIGILRKHREMLPEVFRELGAHHHKRHRTQIRRLADSSAGLER
jgi:hypothetical protein